MVGQDGDAYWLVPSAYLVEDWFDESLVEVLDGFELQFQVAVVASLVACLYVHINEVVAVLQRLDSCCCLSLVVGVGKTGSALNDDVAQPGVMADASYQVYCRNHRTLLDLRIHLREGEHVRTITSAPRPDDVCHALATLLARHVERMALQDFLTLQNQLVQKVGCLLGTHAIFVAQDTAVLSHILGRSLVAVAGKKSLVNTFHRFHQQRFPLFVRMIVRRSAIYIFVSALDDQKVSILDSGDEFHDAGILAGKLLVEVLDEHVGVFCLQVTAVVGHDDSIVHVDDVAAQSEVVRTHLVADACSFERSASLVNLVLVVSHDRTVGNLRSRMKSVGYGYQSSSLSFLCQHVHIRFVGVLQERLASQSFYSVVGHAVAKYDNMLHNCYPFYLIRQY